MLSGPRILLAPDKFKGSLCAAEVRGAFENGLRQIFPGACFTHAPIADGGEGTSAAILQALGGEAVTIDALDPLGRPVRAAFAEVAINGNQVAVIEMSAASGFERVLDVVPPQPQFASTFGTGQMIRAAAARGVRQILLGIGGSATNDGGAGMAQALGYRFDDSDGKPLTAIPDRLEQLQRITRPEENLNLPEILVACDVDNPLLGDHGATRIYGPQKGIRETDFPLFEARLEALAEAAEKLAGRRLRNLPGAGAAGGLGFGLMAFCDAELRPGFKLVSAITGLEEAVERADLIITGEGSLDAQTLNGKGPAGVAAMARAAGVPIVAVCGIADTENPELGETFDHILTIRPLANCTEQAVSEAAQLIERVILQSRDLILRLAGSTS
jgi:glycerate kinase